MASELVGFSGSRNWVRTVVAANVLLFLAYSGFYMYDDVYSKLKAANLADPIAWCVYVTLFVSTVFAAILLLRRLLQARSGSTRARSKFTVLDTVLFLIWCSVFGSLCLYGFMLGLRGF